MNSLFPVVYIPEDLTWLNALYLNNSSKSYLVISEEVLKKPFLKLHVKKLFDRYIKAGSFEPMLNALGWKGFRDRLSSSYLYHYYHGVFPDEDELENIADVIRFEEELKGIFPEGNSRAFFLGFFLKMCELNSLSSTSSEFKRYLHLSRELKEALLLGDQKVVRPDWLVLSLMHFESFFGKENLLSLLKKENGNFKKLKKHLSQDQLELMVQNFLRYSAGIGEDEVFIFDKV